MTVDVTDENRAKCLCPGCPTYNDCMRTGSERLFCGVGQSSCDPRAKGCLCPDCPVWSSYELTSTYYCMG